MVETSIQGWATWADDDRTTAATARVESYPLSATYSRPSGPLSRSVIRFVTVGGVLAAASWRVRYVLTFWPSMSQTFSVSSK